MLRAHAPPPARLGAGDRAALLSGLAKGVRLLLNLLPAWLKTEGIGLKEIGLFALIQFPYTWKFLWSPLMDRYALPWLGRTLIGTTDIVLGEVDR